MNRYYVQLFLSPTNHAADLEVDANSEKEAIALAKKIKRLSKAKGYASKI